jgi:hypothetical protein
MKGRKDSLIFQLAKDKHFNILVAVLFKVHIHTYLNENRLVTTIYNNFFETGCHYVAQASFELLILLPQHVLGS